MPRTWAWGPDELRRRIDRIAEADWRMGNGLGLTLALYIAKYLTT